MKKIIKKISLLLIAFGFGFGLLSNAKAIVDPCQEGEKYCINTKNRGIRYYMYDNTSSTKNGNFFGATATTKNTRQFTNAKYYEYYNTLNVEHHAKSKSGEYNDQIYTIWQGYYDNYSPLYCLDGNLPGNTTLHAYRRVGYSTEKPVQVFDYLITHILVQSNKQIINPADNHLSTQFALRAVTYAFGYYRDNKAEASIDGLDEIIKEISGMVYLWLHDDSEFKTTYEELRNKMNSKGIKNLKDYNSYETIYAGGNGGYFKDKNGGSVVSNAKAMVRYAMTDAIKFVDTIGETTSVNPKNPTESVPKITTDATGNEIVTKEVTHTIALSGLDKNNSEHSLTIDDLEFTTIQGLKDLYISEIKIGNNVIYNGNSSFDWTNSMLRGKNLLQENGIEITDGTVMTIKVTAVGIKKSNNKNEELLCTDALNYTLKGKYNGSKNAYNRWPNTVVTVWYGDASATQQRYIGIEDIASLDQENSEGETPWESSYKINLIPACSCDELSKACISTHNMNSAECKALATADCPCALAEAKCSLNNDQTACSYVANSCKSCESKYVGNANCCDANNEYVIVSNSDEEEDNQINIYGLKEDDIISPCFVNMVDEQCKEQDGSCTDVPGVSDQNDNTFTSNQLKGNKYCTLSCEEDYDLQMPSAKLVNAGRFFSFKSRVSGSKTCYTNTINHGEVGQTNSYADDIYDIQVQLIDATNNYNYWNAALSHINNIVEVRGMYTPSASINGCSCKFGEKIPYAISSTTGYFSYTRYDYTSADIKIATGEIKVHPTNVTNAEVTKRTNIISDSVNGTLPNSCGLVPDPYDPDCSGNNKANCNMINQEISCGYQYINGTEWTKGNLIDEIEKQVEIYLSQMQFWQEKYKSTIAEYMACSTSWTSAMSYDPTFYYDYEEHDYMKLLDSISPQTRNGVKNMEEIENKPTTDSTQVFCSGNVNNKYECLVLPSSTNQLRQRFHTYCTPEEGCKDKEEYISISKYIKKTSTIDATYAPAKLFYNIYPTGRITVDSNAENSTVVQTTDGKNGALPVSLERKRGIYDYTVNVTDLGEFYDLTSDNLGRYIGAGAGTPLLKDILVNGDMPYACTYLVNIAYQESVDKVLCSALGCGDNCMAFCIGPNCESECDGDNCIANCVGLGCIYDEDAGSSLYERVVSLTNMFPNGTDAYNWTGNGNALIAEKAKTTIDEIQGKGDTIFDETPVFSVTITPQIARSIKNYNSQVENAGGYGNSTLNCYKLGEYNRGACFSNFLTDLMAGEYGNVNASGSITDSSYRAVGDVSGVSGYFTMWDKYTPAVNGAVGPSWK